MPSPWRRQQWRKESRRAMSDFRNLPGFLNSPRNCEHPSDDLKIFFEASANLGASNGRI
jgi:hypothetical protein